jgi:uroporphyrinogen decarboxylase
VITHRKRIENCLADAPLDRVPIALWRHFPVDDLTPGGLAAATLNFQKTFDLDLVKVTPQSSYCLLDWGIKQEWQGEPEGTYSYTQRVIRQPEDWLRLPVLDPYQGRLGAQLECLKLVAAELGPGTPFLQTIFNPLSQAKNLAGGDTLLIHLRRYPDAVHAGLKTIAETTRQFIESARETGISGVFYAVQHAQYGTLSVEEYREFGRQYDLQVLETSKDMWLNMLHLHGSQVMFEEFIDYPIQVINWHDRETRPTLADGLAKFPGSVCGGLQRHQTLLLGTPDQVTAEAQQAIVSSGGRRHILGTGCVAFTTVPYGNLMAARRSVESKP